MENLLKKLINLHTAKFSRTIKASSDKSDFRINFPVPLMLDKELNYELGLMWFTSYNTIYNITKDNNIFVYSLDQGETFKNLEITPGAYEIKEINSEIQKILGEKNISISPHVSTGKVIMKLSANLVVDFSREKSLHKLLGFEKKIYKGDNISENLARITNVLDINIECDLVNGNYSNGELDNILYSFPANTVPLGWKFIERMNPPNYLPVSQKMIGDIHIRIIDQDGNLINFNGETFNLYLDLKQV